eukprot:scaffold286796_cov32-Tisochrysis_lutea.AAC.6
MKAHESPTERETTGVPAFKLAALSWQSWATSGRNGGGEAGPACSPAGGDSVTVAGSSASRDTTVSPASSSATSTSTPWQLQLPSAGAAPPARFAASVRSPAAATPAYSMARSAHLCGSGGTGRPSMLARTSA